MEERLIEHHQQRMECATTRGQTEDTLESRDNTEVHSTIAEQQALKEMEIMKFRVKK